MTWEAVHSWYDDVVGQKGHYYHQHVLIPSLLRSWTLDKKAHILDVGCGQGVLARHLPKEVAYTGIDISPTLIHDAQKRDRVENHQYLIADATRPLPLAPNTFTHALCMLSLQNMDKPDKALLHITQLLAPGGKVALLLNHPCFRIPRQSHWGVDRVQDVQYRRVDRYLSSMKIPLYTHPGKDPSALTHSYHWPLSQLTLWLFQAGLVIEKMEEWCSTKTSEGGAAARENRARKEFPLFLGCFCLKR